MEHYKNIHQILKEISIWLCYQRQMGLEYLPRALDLPPLIIGNGSASPSISPSSATTAPPTIANRSLPNNKILNQSITKFYKFQNINELQIAIQACAGCAASVTRRPLPIAPKENPELLVVGDIIGHDEEREGVYFAGQARELLEKMLKAIRISITDTYLTALLKCRTKTKPKRADVEHCANFLMAEIELLNPKAILSFTPLLSLPLFGKMLPLSKLRGNVHRVQINDKTLKVCFTHSPSTILNTPQNTQKILKLEAWQDLQNLQKVLEEITS